jgi:hypothetical protein
MTVRVFVPLVDARGEAAHLFEAIAGEVPPEDHPARLVPQIAELFDFGLYGVGQSAREAVMSFIEARRRRLWLSPRNARLTPWHLRISDLQLGRLSDGNARSAGLGLTVAALAQAFGRDPGLVFATGEILPNAPGAFAAGVGPVSGMRGKLALIGDYIAQHGPTLEGQRVVVALPALAEDGRPLEEAERSMLMRLREQADEARVKLTIIFADTLDALEGPLGPFTIPELVTPRRALAAAIVASLIALIMGGWTVLAHAPIRLAFEPPAAGGTTPGADDAAPQRARYDAKADKLELLGPCFDAQRQPLVVGGETLVLKVRAKDALPFASRIRPMRLFIASVSRSADPVILDAAHFRSLASERQEPGDLVAAIPIEPVEDEVRLLVVATRDPNLAISEVEAALRATLRGLTGAAALAATTTFLADRLGAEIAYQFRVTNDPQACAV